MSEAKKVTLGKLTVCFAYPIFAADKSTATTLLRGKALPIFSAMMPMPQPISATRSPSRTMAFNASVAISSRLFGRMR